MNLQQFHNRKAPTPAKPKRVIRTGPPSLFVLDTNVLMHDPSSLFRFSEHDLYLPMTTLEELDNHKKGMTEVARNARTVSRSLDQLIAGISGDTGRHSGSPRVQSHYAR